MNLYGIIDKSICVVYDELVEEGKAVEVINHIASITSTKKYSEYLLFNSVNILKSWLPLLNSTKCKVLVIGNKEELQQITNIKICKFSKELIKDKLTNLGYEFVKSDIISTLVEESIKGSLLIKLNPIIYRQNVRLEDRTTLINSLCEYLFGKMDIDKLKEIYLRFGSKKTNTKIQSFIDFLIDNRYKEIGSKVDGNNWNKVGKDYPNIKIFDLKYLHNKYKG